MDFSKISGQTLFEKNKQTIDEFYSTSESELTKFFNKEYMDPDLENHIKADDKSSKTEN